MGKLCEFLSKNEFEINFTFLHRTRNVVSLHLTGSISTFSDFFLTSIVMQSLFSAYAKYYLQSRPYGINSFLFIEISSLIMHSFIEDYRWSDRYSNMNMNYDSSPLNIYNRNLTLLNLTIYKNSTKTQVLDLRSFNWLRILLISCILQICKCLYNYPLSSTPFFVTAIHFWMPRSIASFLCAMIRLFWMPFTVSLRTW